MLQGVRRARDPIEHIRTLILEHEFAEPGDLKKMEKEIKKVITGCLSPAECKIISSVYPFQSLYQLCCSMLSMAVLPTPVPQIR